MITYLIHREERAKKLIFLYKAVEGLVPAIYIEPDDYLKKARPKRSITANKNCELPDN